MKKSLLVVFLLCSFFLAPWFSFAHAAEITLIVNPNSTTEPAGYKLYFGTASGKYGTPVDLGSRVRDIQFVVSIQLTPDTLYYFAATAYDGNGNESGFSNEVQKRTPPLPPGTPNLIIENIKIYFSVQTGAGDSTTP